MICDNCKNRPYYPAQSPCWKCIDGRVVSGRHFVQASKTNMEIVRTMTPEELVRLFKPSSCPPDYNPGFCYPEDTDCNRCWIDWLKEKAEALENR